MFSGATKFSSSFYLIFLYAKQCIYIYNKRFKQEMQVKEREYKKNKS